MWIKQLRAGSTHAGDVWQREEGADERELPQEGDDDREEVAVGGEPAWHGG